MINIMFPDGTVLRHETGINQEISPRSQGFRILSYYSLELKASLTV